MMGMDVEKVRIWKKTVKAYFNKLSDVLLEGPKKETRKSWVQIACNPSVTRTYINQHCIMEMIGFRGGAEYNETPFKADRHSITPQIIFTKSHTVSIF
jgi:hypothetical protein